MRTRVHPLSGATYDVRPDGLLDITQDGVSGVFDAQGRWVSGDLRHCDPQLCGWLAGPTRVFNQDVYNLPRVQEGLASGALDEVVFARYQETKIRCIQNELMRWIERP